MSKIDLNVFKISRSGITLSTTYLTEHLGIQPGDMVFGMASNGRLLLKRFSPTDLIEAPDWRALGFAESPNAPQLEPSAGDAPVNIPEDDKSDKPDA